MRHSHAKTIHLAEEAGECSTIVLLVGTPNSGKSTLFNQITGGKSRIANWPGVTVDLHYSRLGDTCIVDTPGAYAMDGGTIEEEILVDAITSLKPSKIVFILDGLQPEAGIYLLTQLLEAYQGPVEVLVTKSLLSHGSGIHIDVEGLSRRLGVRINRVSILEGVGMERVKEAISTTSTSKPQLRIDYGPLEPYISILEQLIDEDKIRPLSKRWLAVQLLAGDQVARGIAASIGEGILGEADRIKSALVSQGIDPEDVIASARLDTAETLARRYVIRRTPGELGARIDKVMLHPILGPLASIAILFAAFFAVFSISIGFPLNMILYSLGMPHAAALIEEYSLAGIISMAFDRLLSMVPDQGLAWGLVSGVLSGVGVIASFIPLIAVATAFLAILEDSGIMTRIAVSLHPFLQKLDVSGRSIYPYLLGLGCNVPAIITSRLLPAGERMRVIFSIPFVICSARLIVLLAFVSAFFKGPLTQAVVAASIYTLSALVALITARIAHRIYGGEDPGKPYLVMELPLMHKPSMRVVWWSVRSSLAHFIRKMAGPITVAAVIIWLLLQAPGSGASLGHTIGSTLGTIFEPLGVGEEQAQILGLAGIAGSMVKEVIVETIGVAYGSPDPREAVAALGLTPVQAYSILVFFMFYTPCIATAVAVYSETGRPRLLASLIAYSLAVAVALMYITYAILEVATRWL
ncbi:MAG: ferrous iron transport protein B [Desulfurococcales archaeon]|nr:ferrous iron transport protein B [Desulfurococcales archaeon]